MKARQTRDHFNRLQLYLLVSALFGALAFLILSSCWISFWLTLFPTILGVSCGMGLVLGGLMTPLLLCLNRRVNLADDPYATSNTRHLQFQQSYEDIFTICLESITVLNVRETRIVNPKLGIIEFQTGCSWKCNGEIVTYRLTVQPPEQSKQSEPEVKKEVTQIRVEISSRIAHPFTMLDFGKNYENIELLTDFITQLTRPLPDLKENVPHVP